jgi:hypothetical protein
MIRKIDEARDEMLENLHYQTIEREKLMAKLEGCERTIECIACCLVKHKTDEVLEKT